jgi:hypothetical protein
MRTKTWSIEQMQCFPSIDGKQNVVYVVNWLLTATGNGNTVHIYNTANLEYTPGTPYTDYDKLTPEQVLGWVKNSLGNEQVQAYEVEVDELLAAKAAPQLVTNGLPWVDQTYVPIKLY